MPWRKCGSRLSGGNFCLLKCAVRCSRTWIPQVLKTARNETHPAFNASTAYNLEAVDIKKSNAAGAGSELPAAAHMSGTFTGDHRFGNGRSVWHGPDPGNKFSEQTFHCPGLWVPRLSLCVEIGVPHQSQSSSRSLDLGRHSQCLTCGDCSDHLNRQQWKPLVVRLRWMQKLTNNFILRPSEECLPVASSSAKTTNLPQSTPWRAASTSTDPCCDYANTTARTLRNPCIWWCLELCRGESVAAHMSSIILFGTSWQRANESTLEESNLLKPHSVLC